ncbi:MAG: glycosyltransferase family 2 protein [Chloroflexi bacterium]|nr:glycosyltransferase family 2 protein [Chloroflexota bacterium]
MPPEITVLMSVHNGAATLPEALAGALAQTWRDFELLVIDDGSTDATPEMLSRFTDPRLRVVRNERNLGLTASLNRGLALAQGEYIARMDADDISLPERLARQVRFMKSHPEVAVCGTWVQTFGEREEVWRFPSKHEELRCEMLFENVLAHGSVMLRCAALEAHDLRYDERLVRAQDYDLWARLSRHAALANLPEVLLRYRLHAGQAGAADGAGQQATAQQVRRMQLEWLGLAPSESDMAVHLTLSTWQFEAGLEFLGRGRAWLEGIEEANWRAPVYPARALRRALARRWLAAARAAQRHGLAAWRAYAASRLAQPSLTAVRFYLLCLRAEARHG